jgi:hypothetical protein
MTELRQPYSELSQPSMPGWFQASVALEKARKAHAA